MQTKLSEALCPSPSLSFPSLSPLTQTSLTSSPPFRFPRAHEILIPLATPIMDARSLVRKEAVYTAAGRLVRSLVQNEAVPVQTLLSLLADECLRQGEEWRPLKRRIAWLIGECVRLPLGAAADPSSQLCHVA